MSNIPKSKRTVTKFEFFDHAIKVRSYITKMLLQDFSNDTIRSRDTSDGWIYLNVRNNISRFLSSMIENITLANSIYLPEEQEKFLSSYNLRRRYMNEAIGNCEQVIQELHFAIKILPIKASKYLNVIPLLEREEQQIVKWRQKDNRRFNEVMKKQ